MDVATGLNIRNADTAISRTCCLFSSTSCWCLSGTIIQKSVDNVYPLFQFLCHEPWCEHPFWKATIGQLEDKSEALSRHVVEIKFAFR